MIYRYHEKGNPSVKGAGDSPNFQIIQPHLMQDIPLMPHQAKGRMKDLTDFETERQTQLFLQQEETEMTAELHERIHAADGKPALFLPFIGEFGWRLMWHVHYVHASQASDKAVCIKPGQEILYPSAHLFLDGWEDPIPDALKGGTDPLARDTDRIWPEYEEERWRNWTKMQAGKMSIVMEGYASKLKSTLELKPRKRRGLKVDVCIATRQRDIQPEKNYQHWQVIADWLDLQHMTYAVIGDRKGSSPPLRGQRYMSGDFGDLDAAVELLQSCKVFIGTDSGGAHLAALANGCPMIIQNIQPKFRNFIDSMRRSTCHPLLVVPYECWDSPQEIIRVLKEIL